MYIKPKKSTLNVKVFPVHYSLEFEPVFKNFTFNGKEKITIDCKESLNSIVLHCAELKIKSCHIRHAKTLQKANIKIDVKREELTITIKNKIKGLAFIEIEFVGDLNDRLLGF